MSEVNVVITGLCETPSADADGAALAGSHGLLL